MKTIATDRRRGERGAFTLVELMIALGILAVAIPMVGTAFLAGMVENKESVQRTAGAMVAENALAMVRMQVSNAELAVIAPTPGTIVLLNGAARPSDGTPLLADSDLDWLPDWDRRTGAAPLPMYGCVLFAQRMAANANDWRFIAVPYRRFSEGDVVVLPGVASAWKDGNTKAPPWPAGTADGPATKVVFAATGDTQRVVEYSTSLKYHEYTTVTLKAPASADPYIKSAALGVLVTRMSLRP